MLSRVNDGVPLYDISKLLGHTKQATTTHYAHLSNDRLLAIADAVGCIATGGVRQRVARTCLLPS